MVAWDRDAVITGSAAAKLTFWPDCPHDVISVATRCPSGNAERLRLLLESRTEPWSRAERALHRLLHEAGIDRWQANRLIRIGDRRYYGDIVFPRALLVLEVDGVAFHTDPTVFEVDRVRQNDLQLHGWRVLRFTWDRIHNDPAGVLSEIRFALRHRTRLSTSRRADTR